MPLSHKYIDLEKMPANEKPHILEIATKHNALVREVDMITGATVQDKKMMFSFFQGIRNIEDWFLSKKFSFGAGAIVTLAVVQTLKALGVPTQELGPRILAILDLIIKWGGAS